MANSITLTGAAIDPAEAPDPALCRISGYLRNAKGQALKGWALALRSCYAPLGVYDQALVLQERLVVKADRQGYVEFDLLRGAVVIAELPNLLAHLSARPLLVPDSASLNLVAFLFPYLVSVDWAEPDALAVGVGDTVTACVEGTLSSGEVVSVPSSAVTITTTDAAVVALREGPYYTALSVGTASLEIVAVDASAVVSYTDRLGNPLVLQEVPVVDIPGAPLSVTVS